MIMQLTKILLNNLSSYYIGIVRVEKKDYIALNSIDIEGNLGGIEFFQKSQIKQTVNNSSELSFTQLFHMRTFLI